MRTELLNRNVASLLCGPLIGGLLLAITGCPSTNPPPDLTPPGGPGTHGISVRIAKRYIDRNDNGVIDMPNSVAYVQGPLRVSVDGTRLARSFPASWPYASAENAGFDNTEGPWRWTFAPRSSGSVPQGLATIPFPISGVLGLTGSNDGQRIVTYSGRPALTIDLFEGDWSVELARTDASGSAIYWKTSNVSLSDALIVQLGDSYSSGEGAPDRPADGGLWGDDGTGANGSHASAHRSSKTWGGVFAQHAEPLAQGLGGGSVTFVNLAVSGALIDEVDAQLDEMSALVGPRKVDILFISIGGNDAGFANAIAAYLVREPILDRNALLGPDLDDIEDAIRTGHWTGGSFTDVGSVLVELFDSRVPLRNVRGLNGLAAGYAQLAGRIQAHGVDPHSVYILQYPDPLVPSISNPAEVCPEPILRARANVLGRQLEIGRAEQHSARSALIAPINRQIAASAAQAQWNVVNAEDVMHGRAICNDNRMVLLFKESEDIQGDERGTLHPNARGYEAIADRAFESIR